jgi:hypothetical protein
VFFLLFGSTLQASLFRDSIYVGENKEKYSYFFSITEFTNLADIVQKLSNKKFSLKKNTYLAVLIEMPNNLNSEQQAALWNQLADLKTALNNTPYNFNVKVQGRVDESISMYTIHLYYR